MNIEVLDLAMMVFPQAAAYILAVKGIASVLCNNLPTQEWGKSGEVLEWLASNNKEAKKTGDAKVDTKIDLIGLGSELIPPNTVVGKALRFLS